MQSRKFIICLNFFIGLKEEVITNLNIDLAAMYVHVLCFSKKGCG